ncbi:FAD/NAD(P)-binding domain-containing protein [Bimuria novae-zelandiae CBS 107.79]|uniref:FAD/NAD(P)-binding domain-containing protein n=1 Tax=Bimuria novae-zelandiae CBS 107.79 TaxID=1447943 RepID=A0A6A5URG7_9PLEO|nr:FAD/NAD(P)-binding domain-containing protein [Bimuria novae-zelandiae CBS 107.79]
MQRSLGNHTDSIGRIDSPYDDPDLDIDVLCIGAGFAGCYLLHNLRKAGFATKVVEAGSDFGGVWHWNSYPGARVDSQWPVYALGIPEIYNNWTWTEHYPGHEELKSYFQFVGEKLNLRRDVEFNKKVVSADWDEKMKGWKVRCEGGFLVHTKFLIAGVGFAAKRYFPPWPGLDSFKGVMHHSSFWPQEGVDVRGKKVAVVGTGATGVQIAQTWAKEIGEDGSLTVLQRTPNTACPMRQKTISKEEDAEMKANLGEMFQERLTHDGGFLYSPRTDLKTFDHSAEEIERFFEELWEMGGFRFISNTYGDIYLNKKANDEAYKFWAKKTRARINDPHKRDILAPLEGLHIFGGKRPSLEQDYYEQFNKSNVLVLDLRATPIVDIVPEGVRTADGKVHEFDVIALATGYDSITGGLKDIDFRSAQGELLRDKWEKGTWTHLGMATSSFPNFLFLYGPQGPTANANGPSCVEAQADWIVDVLQWMRDEDKVRLDATPEAEQEWRKIVHDFSTPSLKHNIPSWNNGGNIPGKPIEPLNYAGGLPRYIRTIVHVRRHGMEGFRVE